MSASSPFSSSSSSSLGSSPVQSLLFSHSNNNRQDRRFSTGTETPAIDRRELNHNRFLRLAVI
ncbi:hypothetical protein EJB05_51122, partial [Eragrostis curvula]